MIGIDIVDFVFILEQSTLPYPFHRRTETFNTQLSQPPPSISARIMLTILPPNDPSGCADAIASPLGLIVLCPICPPNLSFCTQLKA